MEAAKEPKIDDLSKEELIVRYKKVISLARNAKQAKDVAISDLNKSKDSEKKLQEEVAVLQELLNSYTEKQTQLAETENRLKISSTENAEAKNKIDLIQKENNGLAKTVRELEEKIQYLEGKLGEIDTEKNSLKTRNHQLEEKLRTSEEKDTLVEKSLVEFKEKYLEEKKKHEKLESLLIKLEEKSEKSSSERSESRNGLQSVPESQELEDVAQENEKLKLKIDLLSKEIDKYKTEVTSMNLLCKQQENSHRDFVTKCLSLMGVVKENLNVAGNDWDSSRKEVLNLTNINQSLSEQLKTLTECSADEVKSLKDEVNRLKCALESAKTENIDQNTDKINQYQNVVEKLKEELEDLRNENQAADVKFSDLQTRVDESTRMSEQLEQLATQYDHWKLKAEAHNRILPGLEKLRTDARNWKINFDSFKSGVLHDFAAWKEDKRLLENDLLQAVYDNAKKLWDTNAELLKDLNEINKELKERGEIISKLQIESADSHNQLKKVSEELNYAENTIKTMQTDLKDRQRVIRGLEEEVARLRTDTDSQADTISSSKISKVEGFQRLSELEALLEKYEKDRSETSDIQKKLEMACDENMRLKKRMEELKNVEVAFKNEKSTFEIIKKELTDQIQALKKTIEKERGKAREWAKERERWLQEQGVISKKLDDEMAKHKLTMQALDEERLKQKKDALLGLEMADYERTVNDLSKKLNAKESQISELLASLDTQRDLSATLHSTVASLEQQVSAEQATADSAKSRQSSLQEEITALQQELLNKAAHITECERLAHELGLEYDSLKLENSNIAAENVKLEEAMRVLQESTKNGLRLSEEANSQLQAKLQRTELELKELKEEFEKYKVRATSVLRQSQADGSLSKKQNIEVEVVQLRASCDSLQAKLDDAVKRLQQTTDENEKAIEEKSRLLKRIQELKADTSQLNAQNAQLQAAEQKLREQYEESVRMIPVQQETLAQCFKREMEEMETRYKTELETTRAALQQVEKALSLHVGRQTPQSHRRQLSSGSGEPGHRRQPSTSFMPVKSERETLDVLMLEREACEGSESVESSSPKILPLEQLLSPQPALASANAVHLAEKLEKSENRIQHLTSLLSDAESDAARLQQLNQVLKEEIRRKERNVAREEHSGNLEYLKNVVVKFGTLPRGDERLRLVPVLNTILKFSKEEEQRMYAAARGEAGAAGWGSYLGGMWSASQ